MEERQETRMERRVRPSLENREKANLGQAEAGGLEGRENPDFPPREEARMGHREKAGVEGPDQGRKGACLGRENRLLLQESVKAGVGESLGSDRKPSRSRMGLSQFQRTPSLANKSTSNELFIHVA